MLIHDNAFNLKDHEPVDCPNSHMIKIENI